MGGLPMAVAGYLATVVGADVFRSVLSGVPCGHGTSGSSVGGDLASIAPPAFADFLDRTENDCRQKQA